MTKHQTFRRLLSGGDRRSIANSDRVLDVVAKDLARVTELVALTEDADWLVTMRAVDLLEKVAHSFPESVAPHKAVFIGKLADSDKWEIRLQIVRALPLFKWSRKQRARVLEILQRDASHPQKFVRAWALNSLATFAQENQALMPAVELFLAEFENSGSRALSARSASNSPAAFAILIQSPRCFGTKSEN